MQEKVTKENTPQRMSPCAHPALREASTACVPRIACPCASRGIGAIHLAATAGIAASAAAMRCGPRESKATRSRAQKQGKVLTLAVAVGCMLGAQAAKAIPPPPYEWHEVQLSAAQTNALAQQACAKAHDGGMEKATATVEEYLSDHHKELSASVQCRTHRTIQSFAIYDRTTCKDVKGQWQCDYPHEEFAAKVFGKDVRVSSSNMALDEVVPIFKFLSSQKDPHSDSHLVDPRSCGFYRASDSKVSTYCAGEYVEIGVDCSRGTRCRYSVLSQKTER